MTEESYTLHCINFSCSSLYRIFFAFCIEKCKRPYKVITCETDGRVLGFNHLKFSIQSNVQK